jgi:hypothetical protein
MRGAAWRSYCWTIGLRLNHEAMKKDRKDAEIHDVTSRINGTIDHPFSVVSTSTGVKECEVIERCTASPARFRP